MTPQQLMLILMAVVGIGLFFAGRHYVRKLASEKTPSFMPATIISARGIAVMVASLVSWGGALLAVASLLLVFS